MFLPLIPVSTFYSIFHFSGYQLLCFLSRKLIFFLHHHLPLHPCRFLESVKTLLVLLPLCPSDPFLAFHCHCHTLVQTPPSLNYCYLSHWSVFSLASLYSHSFSNQHHRFIMPSPYLKPSVVSHCMQNPVQTLTHEKFIYDLVPDCLTKPIFCHHVLHHYVS